MAVTPCASSDGLVGGDRSHAMRGAVLYAPGDVRFEERDAPKIIEPTDAVIRMSATCVCGSDLWPYRGISPVAQPTPMGHEYCGIVEEVGRAVTSAKPGQFVIGSFFASDNTCPNCQAGYQSSCQHKEFVTTAQAPLLRVPLADGTLVATPGVPSEDLVPSLLALYDVMGTGWFAAHAANVKPGKTVVVVGDGAVGLLGVLSARQMGAKRIIAMSRNESRQTLAREFGATDIVTQRGDEGVARIKELTKGIGADSVLESQIATETAKLIAPAACGRPRRSIRAWPSTREKTCTPDCLFTRRGLRIQHFTKPLFTWPVSTTAIIESRQRRIGAGQLAGVQCGIALLAPGASRLPLESHPPVPARPQIPRRSPRPNARAGIRSRSIAARFFLQWAAASAGAGLADLPRLPAAPAAATLL